MKPLILSQQKLSTEPKHIEQVKSSAFISLWKVRIRLLLQLKFQYLFCRNLARVNNELEVHYNFDPVKDK